MTLSFQLQLKLDWGESRWMMRTLRCCYCVDNYYCGGGEVHCFDVFSNIFSHVPYHYHDVDVTDEGVRDVFHVKLRLNDLQAVILQISTNVNTFNHYYQN